MLTDLEYIALQLVAVAVVGAVLVGIANTPLYPLAIGIEATALLYVLFSVNGHAAISAIIAFIDHPGAVVNRTPAQPVG